MRILTAFVFAFLLACGASWAADFQALMRQGQEAYKAGDFVQAGKLLEEAANELYRQKNPQAPLLWGNAAIALIKAENFMAAAQLYEKILAQKNPPKEKLAQYYANLVYCYGQLKQPQMQISAIERQLKAINKMPPDALAETYARQGDAYRSMELYHPASGAYDKALKILPKEARPEQRAKLYTALGLSQGMTGDYVSAEASLKKARELADALGEQLTIAEADSNLGSLLQEQGDYAGAMKYFQAALEREQKAGLRLNEGSDWNNLGIAKRGTGQYAEAMADINKAVDIAREVKNHRGEGFALTNRALGYRLAGQLKEASADYAGALKAFEKAGVQEGLGAALLGRGRIAELNYDYAQALDDYQKALEIFDRLKMPRWQAAAYLNMGKLYNRMTAPGRTTRDLVFNDEPDMPDLKGVDTNEKARECFLEALRLAQSIGSREMIYEAEQGLGFTDFREGKLEAALKHYQTAIDGLSKMYVSLEQAQVLGDFLAEREDLYEGAIEVCNALYNKTKDKKYLDLQLKYSETLKNEVHKASVALANLTFEDPAKQKLYKQLINKAKSQAKARKTIPVSNAAAASPALADKMARMQTEKAAAAQMAEITKMDKEYAALLAEWKKKYPQDAAIFDSYNERVNIAEIQKHLEKGQAALLYLSMPESLLITVIKKDSVSNFNEKVSEKELRKLIIDDFVVDYVHKGFKLEQVDKLENGQKKFYDDSTKALSQLYYYLIRPIENEIKDENRLYIICDGFLSQIPFSMLVITDESGKPIIDNDNMKNGPHPVYLVERKEISNIRPSFLSALKKERPSSQLKLMLAVANPDNKNFPMAKLRGTINEVSKANKNLKSQENNTDIALTTLVKREDGVTGLEDISDKVKADFSNLPNILGNKPTEEWLRKQLSQVPYEIIYFATHGQSQSDTFTKIAAVERDLKNTDNPAIRRQAEEDYNTSSFKKIKEMVENYNIKGHTPLNGFLYLSSMPGDLILDKNKNPTHIDLPHERDGLLTIGEIIAMGDDKRPNPFENTKLVLLSACNAAVELVPFSYGEGFVDEDEASNDRQIQTDKTGAGLDPSQTAKDMENAGLKPGVDQATFVESFMRRGVPNVYASFWQLDDEAGSAIMEGFWEKLNDPNGAPDPVAALSNAQKDYIAKAKNGQITRQKAVDNPLQPYFWAPGGMFGK